MEHTDFPKRISSECAVTGESFIFLGVLVLFSILIISVNDAKFELCGAITAVLYDCMDCESVCVCAIL